MPSPWMRPAESIHRECPWPVDFPRPLGASGWRERVKGIPQDAKALWSRDLAHVAGALSENLSQPSRSRRKAVGLLSPGQDDLCGS
jgi:hypothetical protein